ncbi:class I SAM-dependent methyltransferase [Kutzneria sp. CA-103260]|uniref:class I SAM-dependent methyltransferase n=1 Tax=Kutzneria sp. CA-103260 TaxID=2802641 RepID=UPI001BA5CBB6|nr:class I SAM-dependent methyltransferase [Kutzneria sp. CA-103260]QUQ65335.1 2-methoxy-6-polyprenyl-1,4-benzoquinol methylase, mitochondrial [Kutzneria sp. CA-103260]
MPALAGVLSSTLRCPQCLETLRFTASDRQPLPDGVFGVLRCSRHRYPVVDGIPVIRTGVLGVREHMPGRDTPTGPVVDDLVTKVLGPDPLGALVDLLGAATHGPGAPAARWRREVRALVSRPPAELTAQDWLHLVYVRSQDANRQLYPYFLYRFSQPRYLASLSLTSAFPPTDLPVLDLACGLGHVIHHLTSRPRPCEVVGVDLNFFQVWVARRAIAPAGHYVCADGSQPLPFRDGVFGTTLCTDAFHLFEDKRSALSELRRCTVSGTVFLDRMGVRATRAARDFLGVADYRVLGEDELVDGYLTGHGPQLERPRPERELTSQRWQSLVVSDDPTVFTAPVPFPTPPHLAGRLGLNPVYQVEHRDAHVRLRFEFPNDWYAAEHRRSTEYHAADLELSHQCFAEAAAGQPRVDLIRRFAQIGLPDRYVRQPVARERY